ncbi:MAG: NAD(P)/FAD-dependent oxidoreductase [Candidatus Thermoplasmatota archaeon]|nr:NAD(P)/FAD-dependent oxidoreductase [Candidatus Thermoplasmatota archaeon]
MQVDIIGGGVAGLSTAISLKKRDEHISVSLYERHPTIAYNHDGRRCGEAFFSEINNQWIPEGKSVFNNIHQVEIFIGNKTYYEKFPPSNSPTFMLNKPAFINQLAKQAEEYDVNIQTNAQISKINQLSADVIIDASGCPSIIKKSLGLDQGLKGLTYQETLTNCNFFDQHRIKIYYFGKVGYYWIFPRNPATKEVNVGVGLLETRQISLPKLLYSFMNKMNITGKPVYYAGGLIPLGLQPPFQKNNILFVGDAGVGTFPYLGEGIRRALISGELAAECIVKNKIKSYSTELKKRFYLWDFIGKFGIKASKKASLISEDAMFFLLHRYFDFVNSQYTIKY